MQEETNTPKDSEPEPVFEATSNPFALTRAAMSDEAMEFSYGRSVCAQCDKGFDYRWLKGEAYTVPTKCVRCHDAELEAIEAERIAKEADKRRQENRMLGVPPIYAENNVSRFPEVWQKISQWRPRDGQGLGLVGLTRLCKTRMVYQRLMDLREFEGLRWTAVTGFGLQQAIQRQWQEPELKTSLKKWRQTPVLFIDDLGKQKFTESAEAELFDLMEERTAYKRPIVFTSNLVGKELEKMISENVAGPLLGRLREFCEIHIVRA